MRDELFRIRTDLASSMIHVGEFNQPAAGLTVYAQDVDQSGAYHNMFLLQEKQGDGDVTYIAARGQDGASATVSPVLIMRRRLEPGILPTPGVLNFVKFEEYTFDLSSFMSSDVIVRYKIADRYLHELFFPDLTQDWERKNRKAMLAEGNARLSAPLYNIAFMAMALAAVIGGPFSRLGYGRQIVTVASAAMTVVQFACWGFGPPWPPAPATPGSNLLQYCPDPRSACLRACRRRAIAVPAAKPRHVSDAAPMRRGRRIRRAAGQGGRTELAPGDALKRYVLVPQP